MPAAAEAVKASITTKNLQHALKVISGVVERATTIPIIQGVRFEQRQEGLAAEATNLDLSIRVLFGQESGLAAPIVTPAHKLAAWAKLLSGESVSMKAGESRLTVTCGHARATLPLYAEKQWPKLTFETDGDELTLEVAELKRALGFTILASSVEESRYTLNAVLFTGDGNELRLVATDGHRMMVYTLAGKAKLNQTMPRGMVKALLPLLDDAQGVELDFGKELIAATLPGDEPVFLTSRRVTGTFPHWEAVLPKSADRVRVELPVADLLTSAERCALLSPVESNAIALEFSPDRLTMTSANAEWGESEETIELGALPLKENVRIGLNARYLLDLLKKLDSAGKITLAIPASAGQPLLFQAMPAEGERIDYVVMPLRLEK